MKGMGKAYNKVFTIMFQFTKLASQVYRCLIVMINKRLLKSEHINFWAGEQKIRLSV